MAIVRILALLALLPRLGGQMAVRQQLKQLKQWHDEGLLSTTVWEEKQRATLLLLDAPSVAAEVHTAALAPVPLPPPPSPGPVRFGRSRLLHRWVSWLACLRRR